MIKTVKSWSSAQNKYVDIECIGVVKYVGDSFFSFVDGSQYSVVGVNKEMIRVIDESGEDFLYTINNPRPLVDGLSPGGKWLIIEDYLGILCASFEKYVAKDGQ